TSSGGTWSGTGTGGRPEPRMVILAFVSAFGEAAIDQQLDAGDEAGGGTRQEQHRAGDLDGLGLPAHGGSAGHGGGAGHRSVGGPDIGSALGRHAARQDGV